MFCGRYIIIAALALSAGVSPVTWAQSKPVSAATQKAAPESGPVTGPAEVLSLLNLDFPGFESIKSAAANGDISAVKQAYFDFRRNRSTARLSRDFPPPTVTGKTDEVADEICRHIIRNTYNFGPRSADMGKDFNWKYNPIPKDSPSYTQEWTWCSVARVHFWGTLTTAYSNTGNEKYAQEWVDQMLDFAAKNPVGQRLKPGESSLWRTLDSAIRMYSLASSYYRCLHSSAWNPEAQWIYLRLMNDHAIHLRNHLTPGRTGNWVTTECAALYLIGTIFPEFKDAPEWRRIAIERLMHEANFAVPPDGFEAELTPNYHFVTLNGYITPLELARRNNLTLPSDFESKMLAMYRAAVLIMDQNGKMPPVNDSAIIDAVERARQGVRLLGPDPILLWAATGGKEGQQPPTSVELPYAGFYAMRSGWQPLDTFLFFRGGPAGIGHQHEDMLQVILAAGGKTLLFDPGTYSYDHSDSRRYSINTASHNTIIVDGKWQHRGPNKPPVNEKVQNPWVTTPRFDYVSSLYDGGYQANEYDAGRQYEPQKWVGEIDRSVTHTRHVLFIKPDYIFVIDSLAGSGEHTVDAHFHLDSPSAKKDSAGNVTSENSSGMQLTLYPLERTNLKTDIVIGQKEPLLGWFTGGNETETRPIPTVRFRKKQDVPATFATLLIPHAAAAPKVISETPAQPDADIWSGNVSIDDQRFSLAISKNQKARRLSIPDSPAGSVSAHAAGIWIGQSANRLQTDIGLWNATEWSSSDLQLTTRNPVSLSIVAYDGYLYIYNGTTIDFSLQLQKPCATGMVIRGGTWMRIGKEGVNESSGPGH